ncbi:MAG: non-ribosomal peptide synthetase, partial [Limisphaerales bacterium]
MLAAFQALLYRYTSQDEIIIGTPIAGRNRVETEPLIGFFVNTLALRADFSDDPTFRQLLARARDSSLGAFSNQDLPFEKLVEEIQPERNASQNPLFNVLFAFQNRMVEELQIPGLTFSAIEVDSGTAKFDLTLVLHENGEKLAATLEYNTDLFEAATAARLLVHLETLLEGIIAEPDQRISQMPILTPAERHQILIEWNQTKSNYPKDATVHQLFSAQAQRTPDSIAVIYGNEKISYSELEGRSNQLANYLKKCGVSTDSLVGIYMKRSIEMIVGWLGILKAGAAYVPLDITYPRARLTFMIEDTKMSVLLTQKTRADFQPILEQLQTKKTKKIYLDADWEMISRENKIAPASGATAEHLAYVIYTSGSTGQPKGIAVRHRGIVRLLCDTNYIQLNSTDRIAQTSNSSFDAATFEVWGALLFGGKLIGFEKDLLLSPQDFAARLHQEKISALFITTA